MVGNDERSMIDKDKGWPTAYGRWRLWYDGRWLSYDGRWPKFVISFKLNPFICSEMIGNFKGKMLEVVSRFEDDLQPLQDNLQITEDDLQTKEDDLDIMEDDQNLLFPFN